MAATDRVTANRLNDSFRVSSVFCSLLLNERYACLSRSLTRLFSVLFNSLLRMRKLSA